MLEASENIKEKLVFYFAWVLEFYCSEQGI